MQQVLSSVQFAKVLSNFRPSAVRLLVALCALACAFGEDVDAAEDRGWYLKGIDVFGSRTVDDNQIEALLPFKIGDQVRSDDKTKRNEACDNIKEVFNFFSTYCSVVLIQPDEAYLSVDVVENDEQWRNQYRTPHWRQSLHLPSAVNLALETLSNLEDERYDKGIEIVEKITAGDFLDFDDPELHTTALELKRLARHSRSLVLETLTLAQSSDERRNAAYLLSWVGKPNETMRWALGVADDPDPQVRNLVSRYLVKFLPVIRSQSLRRNIIQTFIKQLERPSFGDRNKALAGLSEIAVTDSGLASIIAAKACYPINAIAQKSTLPNVGGFAKSLRDHLQSKGVWQKECK